MMPARVLITGATGLVGSTLAAACARDGIGVGVLVRNAPRATALAPRATLHPWDATRGPPPDAAFEGVDVVVNMMGESIAEGRWTDARKKALRDSRIVGTRALVDSMRGLAKKPRLLISASAAGYYGDRGGEILTEASASGQGFLAELARDWEAEATRAAEAGVRVVLLRSGLVLARGAGLLGKILTPFKLGLGGKVGDGAQWMPWIHIDDQIGLIRHLMNAESATGPFNAVAPEPVTNAEFTGALGEALGRPTMMRAPAFALRLAVGGDRADELLLASQRVMPVRTLEAGFTFRHPLLRPALKDLVGSRPRPQASPATPSPPG
jgi:uncharacterized protein (TIGR01777 family)